MALILKSRSSFIRYSYPRIDLDPTHNNTILGSKVEQSCDCEHIYLSMEEDNYLQKYKSICFPCLLPFWRRPKKRVQPSSRDDLTGEVSYEFTGQSTILNENQIECIENILPSTTMSLPWTLNFSTQLDGFSLHTLYRHLSKIDSPVLLIIEDTDRKMFGAYSSCKLEKSQTFYGTNQCFLFTFYPVFKYFNASGSNEFFVMGTSDSLIFGADDGAAGLWVDSDLYRGRTEKCKTFNNPPLLQMNNFVIRSLECWSFG